MEIRLSKAFSKTYLKADQQTADRIEACIEKLREEPLSGKPLRYDKRGMRSLHAGTHRMLYSIEGEVLIIHRFERRENVYE